MQKKIGDFLESVKVCDFHLFLNSFTGEVIDFKNSLIEGFKV